VQLGDSLRDFDKIITGMPTRELRMPRAPHPGLTIQEVLVLETMIRAGAMSPGDVSKQTGIPAAVIAPILERLLALRYVNRKGASYEAEAQPTHGQ
jgi:DNA-binding MarR family transcriptional regulator